MVYLLERAIGEHNPEMPEFEEINRDFRGWGGVIFPY